jgi:hypothetical protein
MSLCLTDIPYGFLFVSAPLTHLQARVQKVPSPEDAPLNAVHCSVGAPEILSMVISINEVYGWSQMSGLLVKWSTLVVDQWHWTVCFAIDIQAKVDYSHLITRDKIEVNHLI